LGGGCQLPVGARAWASRDGLRLAAVIAEPNGRKVFREESEGRAEEAESLGTALAERLLSLGAGNILNVENGDPARDAS
jgi:hydroxymethylbilane synthase